MPTIRKLSVEEVQKIEKKTKGQRRMTEEQYDTFLEGYDIGDYGEAELEEGEKRITVRNRLKAAAERRGLTLQFRRTQGNTLRFVVGDQDGEVLDEDEQEELEPVVVSEPEPEIPVASDTPPKRKGRPKKQAE